jgi:hypothetical protein
MPDENDLPALAAAVPLPLTIHKENPDDTFERTWTILSAHDFASVVVNPWHVLNECDEVFAHYLVAAANALPGLVAERERLRAVLRDEALFAARQGHMSLDPYKVAWWGERSKRLFAALAGPGGED